MSEFNIEVQSGSSVRLPTAGKYCDRDIIVTASGGGGAEEIENIIDASGVLESTDGTVTEKVATVTNMAELLKALNTLKVAPALVPERIEFYIDNEIVSLSEAFRDTKNLKFMVGINTSKTTNIKRAFNSSGIEEIQRPLDFSSVTSISNAGAFGNATSLREVRFVPNTIKWSETFPSAVLSNDSIKSILYGLAPLPADTIQTLTVHSDVYEKIISENDLYDAYDTALNNGWDITA